ncbi:spore coat protein [Oceanobacillus sp. CFH 90083]|uniref:spore coat protein n=1 Tax=Oceanobacillus sp. CFH 90083 TaxID=2592336 RepID=UPI00128E28F9|nr:spore coat protein [Oceanobacillus sp. CFH 90083]
MGRNSCQYNRCRHSDRDEEVRVHPTNYEVRKHTNVKTIKNIHPTEIKNVHRTIIRNENYYPVRESNVNETVVENYDCGSDVNNSSNCRRVRGSNSCGSRYQQCHKRFEKRPCKRNRHWFF